ncbi:MAG: YhdH/YhfP family quinone oxidoreductase [Bacteroidales bacterium]|nr:YhdH/YhfP family quinone oxidoreductase [Bacteroidales bacterium]
METVSESNSQSFRALVVEESTSGNFTSSVRKRKTNDLPSGGLLVKVCFSGLNYKDALSFSGNKGITRRYPHTPGIDAAGIVAESTDPGFAQGDEILVTGYDLGMNTSGGLAEYIRVPSRWAVHRPANLSLKECMIIGTSGFTAASAILEIMNHGISPDSGKVLVTGASGAVGITAVAMLAHAGYRVVASTGKSEAAPLLKTLGAEEIISREDVSDQSGRPLLPGRWVAAIETVGGNTLSTVIRSTAERGIVTNCGMIASNNLDVSVFPFILRAVRLVGIASAETPMNRRIELWNLIAGKLKFPGLESISHMITLEQVPDALNAMLKSASTGKIVVRI